MIFFDGLDGALIGCADVWHPDGNRVGRAIYAGDQIVAILMDQGLSYDDAIEHIDFNVEGGYVGEDTPIVCWPNRDQECPYDED